MNDPIREALEALVRQHDGHPRALDKLRRQGLSPDHPTVTATMNGHRLMMERAWTAAREVLARTPYVASREDYEAHKGGDDCSRTAHYFVDGRCIYCQAPEDRPGVKDAITDRQKGEQNG